MGRYAFFSTGLEYKFGFGTQESSDIRLFGGVIVTSGNYYMPGYYCHTWSASKDSDYILEQLQSLIHFSDIQLPDFYKYDQGLNGTNAIYDFFSENYEKMYKEIGGTVETLKLGCLIYHQLLYSPELFVRYE
jgi:hypothetical protein